MYKRICTPPTLNFDCTKKKSEPDEYDRINRRFKLGITNLNQQNVGPEICKIENRGIKLMQSNLYL